MELLNQARLADSRLTGNQHHLSLAFEHALPSVPQEPQLLLATDERRQYPPVGVKPAPHAAGLDYTIKLDSSCDSFELMSAAFLDHEYAGDQSMCFLGDQDSARIGSGLHTRSEVGRVAENVGV